MEHNETLQQHEDTLVMVVALANLIRDYDKKLSDAPADSALMDGWRTARGRAKRMKVEAEARAAEMWESLVEMTAFVGQS